MNMNMLWIERMFATSSPIQLCHCCSEFCLYMKSVLFSLHSDHPVLKKGACSALVCLVVRD